MTFLWTYCKFIMLAILAAGLFGAVHDQISYTVSYEYFTRFKFHQFHLADSPLPERWRVAQIGFLASWWMGVPLGILSGAAGFIHRDAATMRRALYWSLPLMLGFALLFALGGLVYGYLQTSTIDLNRYPNWFIPPNLTHLRAYLCVGYMHNAAYLGGTLAIVVAWGFHGVFKIKHNIRN